jgi:hypothetical protein
MKMNKFQPQLQFVVQNSDIANVMVQRHKERINADLASVKQKIKLGHNELECLNKEWHLQAKETWTEECGKPITKALAALKSLFSVKFEVRYGWSKERSTYRSDKDAEVCNVLVESTEICGKGAGDYYIRSTSDLRKVSEKDCKPFIRPTSVRVPVHYWTGESFARIEDLPRILDMKKGTYSFEFTPELQAKWDEIAEKTVIQLDLYRQRNELLVELDGLPEFEKQVQARLTAQAMSNMGGMPMLAALDASLSRPLLASD